ncbi:MAG: beta strand repeat-containing protein [Acidimicrobiales bacterium]
MTLPSLGLLIASGVPAGAMTQTTTDTTPGETAYPIPVGTLSLEVTVIGAPGSSVGNNQFQPVGTPGQGAEVTATFAPPSGVSTLYLEVGDSSGTNGGGGNSDYAAEGGGESAIQTCSNTSGSCVYSAMPGSDPRLIVAGGGGGGGQSSFSGSGTGGTGGTAGLSSSETGPGPGGAGTDSGNGVAGSGAGLGNTTAAASAGPGSPVCGSGGNATQGTPGIAGNGGDANSGDSSNGGGGGGGWVGGSGGGAGGCARNNPGSGGGGGAGASFIESSATNTTVGTASSGAEVIVTAVISVAPAITSGASTTFTAGTTGNFTVATTGFPTPALSESGALPSGVTFLDNGDGTATLSGAPSAGTGGTYQLIVTASNGIGSAATQDFSLRVDQAPAITSSASTTFTVGAAGNFTVTTTGFPTAALSEWGALPTGLTFVDNGDGTASLAGSPAIGTGGTYLFTVTAANGVSPDAVQDFTLTVYEAPEITSSASATFSVGAAGNFTVTTTGFPTAALSESGALPTGVTFVDNGDGTATLAGAPAGGTGGADGLTVTAANGIGSDAIQDVVLTVDEAPSITSNASTTFTAGTAGNLTVTTTGFPAPALSESGDLPNGLTFSDNGDGTATLAGTPAAGTGGSYSFAIRAANGISPDAIQNFTLTVNEAPSITSAATATFSTGAGGTFTVETSGFPGGRTLVISDGDASLPGGVSFGDNGDGTATLSGTPAAGTGGAYPFTITVSNGISPDAVQDFTLTVDQAPAITSGASTTFTVGTAGNFMVTTTGYPASALSESGALPTGVSFADDGDGTATLSGTPAAGTGGTYSFTITASNGVGSDATQDFTLTVDQAPAITSSASTTFTVGMAGNFMVTTTGYPTSALSESGDLPSGVSFADDGNGTATLSGTPAPGTGGTYSLTITASNGVGSDATQDFTLTVDQAAAITSASGATFTVGTAGNFMVTTTGYPASALSESGALPTGVSFADNGDGTATLAGTPAGGRGGTYAFTVNASNGVGSGATQDFTLTVDQAPAVTSASGATFTVGTAGRFTVTTTGYPASALSESGALPSGLSFTDNGDGTATLAGTPAGGRGGTYALTITASNGVGSDATQDFTLIVDKAPTITSASGTTFTVGTPGRFTVTTTGYPASALSESGALPSGVSFTDNGNGTAVLAGTPTAGTGGNHRFNIKASNGVGSDATEDFTLTVDQAPGIVSAPGTTFTVAAKGSFTVTTTGFPTGQTFALSESGALPAGITFRDHRDGKAEIAGTPAAGTEGTYRLTIKASNGVSPVATQTFTLDVDEVPGYVLASANGDVGTFGAVKFRGSMAGRHLNAPVVGVAAAPDGQGYWLAAGDGGVFSFGKAHFYGSLAHKHLSSPVVGIAVTPDGRGYWLVAADGHVFTFGDAHFFGSVNRALHLRDVVSIFATRSGNGYYVVSSTGKTYRFGRAEEGEGVYAPRITAPVVSATLDWATDGYWLARSDGTVLGVDSPSFGGHGTSVVGMAASPDSKGYFLVTSRGKVFPEGDAKLLASNGHSSLSGTVIGISSPS